IPGPGAFGETHLEVIETADGDGFFAFERLAPGNYAVRAVGNNGLGEIIASAVPVSLSSGASAEIELPVASVAGQLTLDLREESGRDLANALVLLIGRAIKANNVAELTAQVGGSSLIQRAVPPRPIHLTPERVGPHTLCVLPLAEDIRDP